MKQLTIKKRKKRQNKKRIAKSIQFTEDIHLHDEVSALRHVKNQEVTMETREDLSNVTYQFILSVGKKVLEDIDTPSFIRKEYGIRLEKIKKSPSSVIVVEPDEKIIRFLSVIKRKDYAISAGGF